MLNFQQSHTSSINAPPLSHIFDPIIPKHDQSTIKRGRAISKYSTGNPAHHFLGHYFKQYDG